MADELKRKLPDPRIADASYSTDVEIGPDNKLYWARGVAKGEVVTIPMHMVNKAHRD